MPCSPRRVALGWLPPLTEVALAGERGWVKTKNRNYWRWEMEHESAINRRRAKQFV